MYKINNIEKCIVENSEYNKYFIITLIWGRVYKDIKLQCCAPETNITL